MSCTVDSCGTGLDKSITQPGDPDLNSSVLTAQPGLGGIALNWLYPTVNPEGLDRTTIYRNTENDPETAAARYTATGNYFFDRIPNSDTGTKYFYWIRMYSVNGTEGELIGPASATLQPGADQLREILGGKVTDAFLDVGLSERIRDIVLVRDALDEEIQARHDEDGSLALLVSSLEDALSDVSTLVTAETEARTTADSALVNKINVALAQANKNAAAILEESTVRADANEALSATVKTLQAATESNNAKLQEQAVVNAELGAEWILKTDVDGKVAGLALRNGDGESEFVVNVDTFAITDTDADGEVVTPFIISEVNGEKIISLDARTLIKEGDITNLMIGNVIQSYDFDSYLKTGWRLDKEAGLVVYSGGHFEGDIHAFNGTFRGEIHAEGDSTFKGDVEADSLVVNDFIRIGQATPVGWEDIETFEVMKNDHFDVDERQKKIVLSLDVTLTDPTHRVFIDWGVQLGSRKGKHYWPCRVRFSRGDTRFYSRDGTVGLWASSPTVANTTLTGALPGLGTQVLCTHPEWDFRAKESSKYGYEQAEALTEATLLGQIGDLTPPYAGAPFIEHHRSQYKNTDGSKKSPNYGKTYYVADSKCDKFIAPVENILAAHGLHGEYRSEWLSRSALLEDMPGLGTWTYEIEVYIKNDDTTPYTYAKDRFIKAIVQKPLLDRD